MIFSKATEYGIRAVIFIAQQSALGRRTGVKAVAEAVQSPEPFTAKILQELVRRNLIRSVKGPNGGFELEKNGYDLTLAHIVLALDGDSLFTGCALGLKECSEEKPCPVHNRYKDVKDGLISMLEETNIEALSRDLTLGTIFLKS